MASTEADLRSTKPGRKRLLITVTTLLSFVIGTPFWYKSTQVYRAPLPFGDIDAYSTWASSNALQLRCHLHVIFASGVQTLFTEAQLDSVASRIQRHIDSLIEGSPAEKQSCKAGIELLVTVDAPNLCLRSREEQGLGFTIWPCGLGSTSLLKELNLSDDDVVDQILWEFSRLDNKGRALNSSPAAYYGGRYTVVVMQKGNLDGSESCSHNTDGGQSSACNMKEDFHFRTVVGKYRHAWISGGISLSTIEEDMTSRIGELAVQYFGGEKVGSADNKGTSMPLSADGEAILSFSLLNAEPSDWIFDWNFQDLDERFIRPVVESLKGSAQLSVESQVLYYTPKAVQSHWVSELNAHVVSAKQLPFFVNANEWHLDTSSAATGRSKILHFAIYVPAADEWPLQFQMDNGELSSTNAFTSPGWGGVAVWNPAKRLTPDSTSGKPNVTVLTTKDFEPLAGVFVAQLRTLFGLPVTIVDDYDTGVFSLPASGTGFTDWELDVLLRRHAIDDMAASATTLISLSRLGARPCHPSLTLVVNNMLWPSFSELNRTFNLLHDLYEHCPVRKLPNMLIMDEIGNQVKSSLRSAGAARLFAAQGTYWATAEAARMAKSLAEAAFFHPSIMSLLYNPAEHHLAIYTPFFVPVLLHAVLAVLKEVSRYRQEWKRLKRKQQQETLELVPSTPSEAAQGSN